MARGRRSVCLFYESLPLSSNCKISLWPVKVIIRMYSVVRALLAFLTGYFWCRASLQIENAMLRHQLAATLKHLLTGYFHYYPRWRIHLGLATETPDVRPVHSSDLCDIVEIADPGGLHHHYIWQAA